MSHIPSAAMPHAKPHEPAPPAAAPAKREPLPLAALAAGGVLAIGGAVAAALLLRGRGDRKPAHRATRSRKPAKTARARTRNAGTAEHGKD